MRFGVLLIVVIIIASCKKEYPNVQTQVLGHAGESIIKSRSKYPPNTVESVKRALELGANGVEIDVQMTADGYLLAYHDASLDENSTGTGCINSQTYTDIQDISIYNSDTKIQLLKEISDFVLHQYKPLLLDIKHYNDCSESTIDFSQFNASLNNLLSSYTDDQKALVTVNCRNQYIFNYLTDTLISKSLESDDFAFALPVIKNKGLDMLTIKLDAMRQEIKDSLTANNIFLSIYNVKTRGEVYKSLEFDPEFVISDNIECTIKAIDG